MSIVVTNLTKTFGKQIAVNNISFEVRKGEILGFLGPNGAGKSTTMKIATGYIPPTNGSVKVMNYDVVDSPLEVKRVVGYLPEHNPLYLDMYVNEYLNFIGSLHNIKRVFLQNRIKEMIQLCGLDIERKKKIGALSKGYRQRVGLAQALIHNPEVLILDEPTTGLDPNQIVEIRNLIKNIGKEKTVIFSTHIMQEVQAICDRVVIINGGVKVADSKVEDLKSLQSSSKIITEFDIDIDQEILKGIEGLDQIKKIGSGKYELVAGVRDIRGDIFKIASENGWTLIGMRQEESSMEKIFQELTNSKNDLV